MTFIINLVLHNIMIMTLNPYDHITKSLSTCVSTIR